MKYCQLIIMTRSKLLGWMLDLLLRVIKHTIMAGSNTKDGFNGVEKRMMILN